MAMTGYIRVAGLQVTILEDQKALELLHNGLLSVRERN